jgi:hypothetical protein
MTFTSDPLYELFHGQRRESSRTVNRRIGEATDQPESSLQCDRSRGRRRSVESRRRRAVVVARYVVFARFSSVQTVVDARLNDGVWTESSPKATTGRGIVSRPDRRQLDDSLVRAQRAGKPNQAPASTEWNHRAPSPPTL